MDGFSEEVVRMMIDRGLFIQDDDGTYRMSEEVERFIRTKVEADPTLFAKLFPERLQ